MSSENNSLSFWSHTPYTLQQIFTQQIFAVLSGTNTLTLQSIVNFQSLFFLDKNIISGYIIWRREMGGRVGGWIALS
jgi:hypothetical protein